MFKKVRVRRSFSVVGLVVCLSLVNLSLVASAEDCSSNSKLESTSKKNDDAYQKPLGSWLFESGCTCQCSNTKDIEGEYALCVVINSNNSSSKGSISKKEEDGK